MLKFILIPNKEKFLQLISKSSGKIYLHLPDGSICDLKDDQTALQMLKLMKPASDGLCFSFSDPSDSVIFMRYMMETVYD